MRSGTVQAKVIFDKVDGMYYTYILQLSNAKYYVGYSGDLSRRIQAHQNGQISSTKKFQPVKLIFYASFTSKIKALQFEKYLKSSSGHAFSNKHFL